VSGVPTSFHLGPLQFHLYGFGLAIAAYVAYLYSRRRLETAGFDTAPYARFAAAMVASGLVGARLANIATNWSYYSGHPARWLAVWQGGLASFGGIALAAPVGIVLQRRWWPPGTLVRFVDAMIPALVAAWALGRVLGPQFMVDGGGHVTHQWFGLSYAGQVGKRVPVPLIQGAEDGLLWLALIWSEHRWTARSVGTISGITMLVWGLVRASDERWLLGQQSHSGSLGVQIAGIVLAIGGAAMLLKQRRTSTHAA